MSPVASIPYALTFKPIIQNEFISSLAIMHSRLEYVTIYNQSITLLIAESITL